MTKTSDVSLEAVDSNLLPISHKHGDGGAVPLRSESNLDSTRNECYELVNKSDDTKEDENDAVIENVACHICDINVPKVYFNEHKNGFRHKFNRKVADTALKRLQLYLNKDDINENNEKIPSKHFCTECSIVIHSEDETSHKQTIGHRNSVLLERFLNDFLNYYTNDDYETVDNTKKDVKTKVDEESKNSEINVTINSKKESTKTESAKETKSDENSKRILNSDEQSDNLRPSCELKDGEMMFQIVDSSSISKLKVNEQCYHAIVETGATFEHCMICDQMFVRENRKLHVDSDLHDQKLHQKSLDNNCVRKINSTLHHCILCNDYFTEYDLHVNSKKHLTNFQNQIIYKCKKTAQDNDHCNKDEKSDSSKEYSDDLRSDESKSSTETNKSTAPVNKETSNNLLPSTSSSVATDETAENTEKTVKLNPNLYFCNLCQVEVPRHLKSILEHNNSRSHMLKDKKPIDESAADPADNVSKIDETAENSDETVKLDPYFCNVCQVKVTNNLNSIAEHNRGKSHMLKENKQIEVREVDPADNVSEIDEMSENTEKTVKLVPNLYFCNVCQLEVPRHLNSIVEHNRSRSHMLKVNKQIEVREFGRAEKVREVDKNEETNNSLVPSINSSVDTRPKLFCYTCNVWISKNASKQHNKTMKHTFNSISNYHNLMQYFDEENLFCEICKVTVSSVLEEIKNHFTSSDHIKKYDKLFKAHSITKINNRKHYCAECKVYILHKNNYLHIKSEEHTDKVNFSETDKIDEQSDDITDSIDSDATEATALVDSDSVGSDNTTDNNEVNAANSTTSETGDPLGFDCINSKASLNTFIDKLELELPKHFSQRETSSDREFNSSDNFSKIDESFEDSFEDSEHSERFEKIPNNLNSITEHNNNTSHLLEDNKKFDKGTVDPADNVSKIDETAENSDKTVKLDPNLYFCNVCQVKVPNNLNNIAEHNRGRSHTQKLQNTKVDNDTEVEGI